MAKFLILIILVVLLSLLQSTGFSIFGVKPNLAMAAIIISAFFIYEIWEGVLLVALAAFIIKFSPGFTPEMIMFLLIGISAVFAAKYLPWHSVFSSLFLIIVGTLIFYLSFAIKLIPSAVFAEELVLNLFFGGLIFALLSVMWQHKMSHR